MKKFEIITIFPEIFNSYFSHSILGRAQKNGLAGIAIHDLREFTDDRRRTVDDTPYGGGAGMVMMIEPIYRCVRKITDKERKLKTRVILFSAKGKRFTQKDVRRLDRYDRLVMICGRYEGVDERVAQKLADEEVSIGDYVLTGGEIPAMVLVDSIARLIPGVLGNLESLAEESHGSPGRLEYPQYTKPEKFNGWQVPKVLLSGNHAAVRKWRESKSKINPEDGKKK